MLLSGAPTKTTVPFANSGAKNTIPVAASATPGLASYTTGFPALTMTPLSAGGIPPAGQDFNGVLNDISRAVQYYSAGATFVYDSAFSSAVSGYPKGAVLQNAAGTGLWLNTTDGNTTNPDSGGAGWVSATNGRLLRTSIYINTAGVLQVSIDGAAFVNASSTFTPLTATNLVQVQVQASGGAGGGGAVTSGSQVAAGSGGGAGGYARKRMTTGFSGVTVVVGAAATGVSGGAGNSGNSSSFGAAVSATGGTGGSLGTALAPSNQPAGGAAGGSGSGGDINVTGGQGQYAIYNAIPVSGKGGFAMFGDGAPPTVNTAGGTASSNYGAAGSGGSVAASSGPAAGGGSKSGVVIVEEFA